MKNFPSPEVTANVVNQSSRYGVKPSIIVLHITVSHNRPGVGDVSGMVDFMNVRSNAVSAHVVNDHEGFDARLVPDHRKAWTQAAYNAPALAIEQIHFDHTTDRDEWMKVAPKQLANTSRWIAYWSIEHGIPIRRAWTPGNGIVARSGVASHKQLGVSGGGHVDPGTGYPMPYVLWGARYFKLKETAPNSKRFREARDEYNKRRVHYGLKVVS